MKAHRVGIVRTGYYLCSYGGWKCSCCSPSVKDRPKARRSVRRKMHQQDKTISDEDMIE